MNTVIDRSPRVGPGLVTLLVVGLYLSTIAVPRIIGSGGAVRLKLIVEASLFTAILGGLGAILVARGQFRFDRRYGGIVMLFVVFLLLSYIGLATGLIRGYPMGDVLGDFYKFVVPIATVLLIYAASESSHQLETAFAIAFRIALLLLTVVLMMYFVGALRLNARPGFIYQYPIVLVLGYWLFRRDDPVARYVPLLALAALPLIYYSQSLSLLLQTGLTASLAVVYSHAEDVDDLVVQGGTLAVVGTIALAFFGVFAVQIPATQWEQYGYLGSKMVAFVGDYTLYERLILLGGSRAAEPIGILTTIDDSWLELLLGSGMGSTFVVSSPFGDPVWATEDHFVHAGLWETVLRTGLTGGFLYLMILVSYLYVGWKVSNDSFLGALAAADASVILIFTPVTGKLLGPRFFSYALFAYALIRWTELRVD